MRWRLDFKVCFTSGEARQCVAYAPGQRWIGEPVTVDEFAGLLGTRFDRIVYKVRVLEEFEHRAGYC